MMFALVPACTASQEEATATAAVTADWIHPDCAAAALQPPRSNACNGPWSFNYIEQWPNVPNCEDSTKACVQYQSCTTWDRDVPGDGLNVNQQSWSEAPASTYEQRCQGGTCSNPTPTATCNSVATQRRTALVATIAPGVPASALKQFTVGGAVNEISVETVGSQLLWTLPSQNHSPLVSCRRMTVDQLPIPPSSVQSFWQEIA